MVALFVGFGIFVISYTLGRAVSTGEAFTRGYIYAYKEIDGLFEAIKVKSKDENITK